MCAVPCGMIVHVTERFLVYVPARYKRSVPTLRLYGVPVAD